MTSRPEPDEQPDLALPSHFNNRELSLLEFNRRVLEQAKDQRTPLLERLRFLCISSTNLDEFFEIRVSGLKQQQELGITKPGADGLGPDETLQQISEVAHTLVDEQYRVLNEVIFPALGEEGIVVLRRERWSDAQRDWVRGYFQREVLPVLTPVGLDPAHPFPPVLNKGLNFIVSLSGEDAFGRDSGTAVVPVPRSLPRLIGMPEGLGPEPQAFALLSSVIHAHVGKLFPGMKITGCYQFRVTRNSDLWVEEEEVDDLLHALKGELPQRNYGATVRLEVPAHCPEHTVEFLLEQFGLGPADLYQVDGPVNLHRLVALCGQLDRRDLKYAPFVPGLPKRLTGNPNLFEVINQGDVLLHHPYQSFTPVLELMRQAAYDPDVLAIKQTVYRIGEKSPVSELLLEAARRGKEVTVVVELRARFDEAANIELATRLQEAGANVVYGVVGYKTHSKMLLLVRREGNELKRYVHMGTGNYHAGTAKGYTDVGYMTCDPQVGADVHAIFQQLTGLGIVPQLARILHAPFTLHARLLEWIDHEAREAQAGRPARIVARMNSLSEPSIIRALYRASQAGVRIELIIRGICCLRPGVPGLSETIRVRSIVGRFLEHSRVYYFYAGGRELTYAASADWMSRNFFRRVETAFPIEETELKAQVVHDCLWTYLEDNAQAWELDAEGRYSRVEPEAGEETHSAQRSLLEQLSGDHQPLRLP
ncbi:MAG: polyphosphate kinase 1 [Planctomycetes bacterium]|nr:polyphosphate kinase 1 [Planctomycetota bacterium]